MKFYKSISTIEQPLMFFYDLLVKGKYDKLVLEFIEHSEPAFLNREELISQENDIDEYGNYVLRENRFSARLSQILLNESQISIDLIEKKHSESNSDSERKDLIIELLHQLYSFYKYSEKVDHIDSENIIQNALFEIVQYIQNRYSYLSIKHDLFRLAHILKEGVIEGSFFGCDTYTTLFLKDLHKILFKYAIINNRENIHESYYHFIDVITSSEPQLSGSKIKFIIDNREVAFIIKIVQDLFTNFNNSTIGQSQAFLSYNDTIFTESNLNSAHSRWKSISQNRRVVIDKAESEIKSLHVNFLNSI